MTGALINRTQEEDHVETQGKDSYKPRRKVSEEASDSQT
jgi:hypothetical protein